MGRAGGGSLTSPEGARGTQRNVVLEFPSYEHALGYATSPEYAEAKALRGELPIHIYNKDGHRISREIFDLYPKLDLGSDSAHAFYLGAELARAEIAWRLAKRYAQDEPLDWGVAADAPADDKTRLKEAGHTLVAKKEAAKKKREAR